MTSTEVHPCRKFIIFLTLLLFCGRTFSLTASFESFSPSEGIRAPCSPRSLDPSTNSYSSPSKRVQSNASATPITNHDIWASKRSSYKESALLRQSSFNLSVTDYELRWKSYQLIIDSNEAWGIYQKLYWELELILHDLALLNYLLFTCQFLVTYGALQLAFIGLPRNLEQARDFVLHFLGLVAEWRIFRPMVLGLYELVAVVQGVNIHIWLRDDDYFAV